MPYFNHDCEGCVYLGSITGAYNYDFHFCPEQNSAIIREGNDAENYQSFPVDSVLGWENDNSLWSLMKSMLLTHAELGYIDLEV